jgi:adenosylcobinamide kinase / adenosylcobinamide-phosphate guanylyltransferase
VSESLDKDGELFLIIGGARAGKSTRALRLAEERERGRGAGVSFIATAQALDEEMAKRIARHRTERPSHWRTIEEPYQLDGALRQTSDSDIVIVDCLTLFVSNWLLKIDDEHQCEGFVRQIADEFLELARSRRQSIICVSNEVGLGVVPDTRLGRIFRDLLGRVNQSFSEAAHEVHLLVAGLSLKLKPTA